MTKSVVIDWPTSSRQLLIGFAGESAPFYSLTTSPLITKTANKKSNEELNWTELYLEISQLFQRIFYNFLRVKPRQCRVLIVEGLFLRSELRDCIYSVLFHDFQVGAISFQPNISMVALASGSSAGLVVDIDSEESLVISFSHQRLLLSSLRTASGSRACIQELQRILTEKGISQELLEEREDVVETLWSSLSHHSFTDNKEEFVIDENLRHKLGVTSTSFPSIEREELDRCRAALTLGSSLTDGRIYADKGLSECIVESIAANHLEDRSAVISNLIVSGRGASSLGNSHSLIISGLRLFLEGLSPSDDRFRSETKRIITELQAKKEVDISVFPAEQLSWVGGSLFAFANQNNDKAFITLTELNKECDSATKVKMVAPDWMSIGVKRTNFCR